MISDVIGLFYIGSNILKERVTSILTTKICSTLNNGGSAFLLTAQYLSPHFMASHPIVIAMGIPNPTELQSYQMDKYHSTVVYTEQNQGLS
jgi:hypothetical protein